MCERERERERITERERERERITERERERESQREREPPCAVAWINMCAHLRNLKQIVWTHTKTLHTLATLGSAALAATVALPGRGEANFTQAII